MSSHNSLILYLDDVTDLRDILLAWNGEDLYDANPFHKIVDYVAATGANNPKLLMVGGNGFFNQTAAKYHNGEAAAISAKLREIPDQNWVRFSRRQGYYSDLMRGFLTYDPSVAAKSTFAASPLHYFSDSGRVLYFDDENDAAFQLTCAPSAGHHADLHTDNPCDRLGGVPAAGHFTLRRGKIGLLVSPDDGYALQSITRSCMLIDGVGQFGDIGYPMSIPSKIHRGEKIEFARWDDAAQTGHVRLNIAPAYPNEMGLAHYTRDFLISHERIIVRDYVVLDAPKTLSWLFQTKREIGAEILPDKSTFMARIGGENGITLQAQPADFRLNISIHETPVVWSYNSDNGFKPFDHMRFDTQYPVQCAAVDFVIRW